jgi:hypothetical protein
MSIPMSQISSTPFNAGEQACSGYSLAQQLEALRAYATREGYEVLEEVLDPGQSGATLERPGMDRVRDLIAASGVSLVLTQDRDRFAREPAYLFYTYDYYYCCSQRSRYGPDVCANSHRSRAGELEASVWNLLSGLLKDPARLRAGLEELIEEERRAVRGKPREGGRGVGEEARCGRQQAQRPPQDQQAEGLITLDELRT